MKFLCCLVGLIFALLYFLLPFPLAAKESQRSHSPSFDLNSILKHHLSDSVIWEWNLGGKKVYEGDAAFSDVPFVRQYSFRDEAGRIYKYAGGIPLHLTRRVVQMFLTGILLVFLAVLAARRIARNPYRISGRFSNLFETLFCWCRKDIAEANMHGHGKGFSSYIATLFSFILFMNLAGLVPPIGEGTEKLHHYLFSASEISAAGNALENNLENGLGNGLGNVIEHHATGSTESPFLAIWPGITATGDLSVTFALALLTVLMIWVTGFRCQGFAYFWRVVPNGVPALLYPILWPLEFIVGPLAKGFALTIRLLANMTAGHVIIIALIGFIFQSSSLWFGGAASAAGAAGIVIASIAGTAAVYLLEIMVAFLQAFIFTLLTAIFIGSAVHRH